MNHPVVSGDQWVAARKALLAREKELTHLHDRIAAERRALPWTRLEKNYLFDTPTGRKPLADLFYAGGGYSGKVRAVRRPKTAHS